MRNNCRIEIIGWLSLFFICWIAASPKPGKAFSLLLISFAGNQILTSDFCAGEKMVIELIPKKLLDEMCKINHVLFCVVETSTDLHHVVAHSGTTTCPILKASEHLHC